MATAFNQPLSQALAPKRSRALPTLLLLIGIVIAFAAAAYGYYQQQRTERITIVTRPIHFGQQITAEDITTIEVPFHRPQELAGITDPQLAVGQWATRDFGVNDLLQPGMLSATAPDKPVYPSGEVLAKDMVAFPFSTSTIGPINHRDVVNIGFNDASGDPSRCMSLGGNVVATPAVGADGKTQPYACRMIAGANILYIDEVSKIAYLELPPETAHAVWAVQAAGLQLWGERYGATSQPLPALQRMDITEITSDQVTIPGSTAPNASAAPTNEAKP